MCGILGGNNINWNYDAGIRCMRHRGPDGTKICRLSDYTLAFTRLAIIDLSENGMQPMFSADGLVGIVYNGEIYGYQNLRNNLISRGYQFCSSSDTEVILNAYLEWGEKFIDKVDGMYGMAIYDRREGRIKLYRDRVGIKPLYYYYDGKNFGFASELKGILEMCGNVSFQVDNTAVYDYFNYRCIPEPKTYYKNVYKLMPGHELVFDVKSKRIVKDDVYWRLHINTREGAQRKQSNLIEELQCLLHKSIKEQMVADVPVGTFLSGGIDSSIITYESHKINPLVETFTMGFVERQYDESKYAMHLADKYHICTNMGMFKRSDFEQQIDKIGDWFDEPLGVTNACAVYLISRLAKEKVRVVLSGDGGDEVFGGYSFYQEMKQRERQKVPDNILISNLYKRFRNAGNRDWYWLDDLSFITKKLGGIPRQDDIKIRKSLDIPKDYDTYWLYRKYYKKDLPVYTRMQYLDMKVRIPGRLCALSDRVTMAVSLEARVPFLSRELIEFSFSLSEEDRCPNGEPKGLLKKAYEKEFGTNYVYRHKQGFEIPREYFGRNISSQEYIFNRVWGKDIMIEKKEKK